MGVSRIALVGMECKFLTDECVKELKASNSPRKFQLTVPPARFVYELCWTVVRGELPTSKCRLALDAVDLTNVTVRDDTASLLADTIAHMGQELVQAGDLRNRLIELAKWLVDASLLPVRLLQERCEAEFLYEAEMIKIKAPDLKAKEVRVNTRLLYQQTKFNLLREESEGYAKLITLLTQGGPDGLTSKTAPTVISTIKSLIGHFDLDPNRVFDIVLECFELQPDNDAFLELIPLFPKSHISHILGFKFQFYKRPEVEGPVPDGLFRLAATLVKEKFIDLDSIYAHLLPKDEEAFEQYEETSKKRMEEANKIGKINLAAIGRDLMEEEKAGDVTIDLYAALDMEQEAVAERAEELSLNQKLGLLKGFLCVDDWADAYVLFERLARLNPVAHPAISAGILRAIEKAIAPYCPTPVKGSFTGKATGYASSNGNGDVRRRGPLNIGKEVFQMLSCIGAYLHRDAILLQKVCRVLRAYYSAALAAVQLYIPSANVNESGDMERKRLALKEARIRVEDALGSCLLPSLQLVPANPAVGLEIWEVMSLLPYEVRYRLYGEWEKEDEQTPMLLAARQTARLDTRRILKRLAKENLKQLGRMVAKIAHANPMTVLRTIVHQIEAYKDMIAPVVDAFKFLTQLEYDILEYVVIERLVQAGREKIKEDGLNVSDWLQSLASFWGHLCKKYPSMELRGLFQYLVNQLKKGEGVELVLLQELIQQMASVEFTENMTEDQLEAIAGGEALRYQATAFGVTRNNKALLKSTNRLRDSLLSKEEPKLAVPLLLLIAQHRTIVVVNADVPHIKMVSEQYDRCHGILLQYVDFLTSAVTPVTSYAQLIPTLDDLVHKYHIEPEVAFLVYRPIMRLFKPSKNSSMAWPSDTSKASLDLEKEQSGDALASKDLVLDLGPHKKTITWSELMGTVHSMLPVKAWNSLSPELYATFWGLTLHDLYVPQKRYEAEIAKQRAAFKVLEENSDNSNSAVARRKKEKEKIQEIMDRLKAESVKQEQNMASVHARMLLEKDSWLTSCPDSLKINMEFLQRCIFPRCVFSMMDAVYCARFVYKLHSMETPFFNTVNHIDVLICKTLQPMISSCTEFEAGRLGRFLYETLKMAYYWKSSEAIYDQECGNKPGFAVLYRDPNSTRVTYAQYIRVHWKWSSRLTKLIIQCLESTEYMEIRNALTVLTKISSVFPVMKKSGLNIERRVSKIKGDEREDLKVLAIGVTAALATRKNAWVTEEDFGMGYIDIKSNASPAKALVANTAPPNLSITSGPSPLAGTSASSGVELSNTISMPSAELASEDAPPEPTLGRPDIPAALLKSDLARSTSAPSRPSSVIGETKASSGLVSPAAPSASKAPSASSLRAGADGVVRAGPPPAHGGKGEEPVRQAIKGTPETEARSQVRRSSQVTSASPHGAGGRAIKSELSKQESATSTSEGASFGLPQVPGDRDLAVRSLDQVRRATGASATSNGASNVAIATVKAPSVLPRSGSDRGAQESFGRSSRVPGEHISRSESAVKGDVGGNRLSDGKGVVDRERFDGHDLGRSHTPSKSPARREENSRVTEELGKDRPGKRAVVLEEAERLNKRRKGEVGDGEMRLSDRERGSERMVEAQRSVERDRLGYEERSFDRLRDERPRDRSLERARDRVVERVERDYRGLDRSVDKLDRDRGDDHVERLRDRSTERFGGDRGLDRSAERGFDRGVDRLRDERVKDERARMRLPSDQPLINDRYTPSYSVASIAPPHPSPVISHIGPLSLPGNRADDDMERRMRSLQRMSPSREDKRRADESQRGQRMSPSRDDKRRADESLLMAIDESKRRREEELRDRKRDDRELVLKSEKEREREKEKALLLKEEADGASKRRRLKRGDIPSTDVPPSFGPPPGPVSASVPQVFDGRDRDRKGGGIPRNIYMEEPVYEKGLSGRGHNKEGGAKLGRREHEMFDRDWEEDKRQQRGDMKRRHHRK